MQAISKQLLCRSFTQFILYGIFSKDRGTGESEQLDVGKIGFYPGVCFTKLTSMAFIENEDYPFVFKQLHFRLMVFLADCRVQLLNGGNDEFCIICKLIDQRICIIRSIYAAFAE